MKMETRPFFFEKFATVKSESFSYGDADARTLLQPCEDTGQSLVIDYI